MACDNCNCTEEPYPLLGIYQGNGGAFLEYKTPESACFDLAFEPGDQKTVKTINMYGLEEEAEIDGGFVHTSPNTIYLFPTGIHMDIPKGYSVRVFPRSSTPIRHGLMLANSVGVIDSDYVGEILLMMIAIRPSYIEVGTRLCQAEMVPVTRAGLMFMIKKPALKGTRTGGLGSTGV